MQVQDPARRRGYDEDWFKQKLPLSYLYLKNFENDLKERSGFRKFFCDDGDIRSANAPFYTIYNVSQYTLSPFKVVWGRVANEIDAAVAGPKKDKFLGKRVQIPYECMAVSLEDEAEAHYLCALINSAPARMVIKSYIVLHPDAHVLEHVRFPQFDAKDKQHCRLAALSAEAHEFATTASTSEKAIKQLGLVETEIDEIAAAVWGVTSAELKDIQFSLADLR